MCMCLLPTLRGVIMAEPHHVLRSIAQKDLDAAQKLLLEGASMEVGVGLAKKWLGSPGGGLALATASYKITEGFVS